MTRRAVHGAGVGEFGGMMRVDWVGLDLIGVDLIGVDVIGRGSSHRFGVVDRLIDFVEDVRAPVVRGGAYT